MRLTFGELKCASGFTRQATAARGVLSHALLAPPFVKQRNLPFSFGFLYDRISSYFNIHIHVGDCTLQILTVWTDVAVSHVKAPL